MKYVTIGYDRYLSYMIGKHEPNNYKKYRSNIAKLDLKAIEKLFLESQYIKDITELKFIYNERIKELEFNLSYSIVYPYEFIIFVWDTINQYLENKFGYDRENIRQVIIIKRDDLPCMLTGTDY